ncbi:MAG: hypothetical protein H6842_07695 [Rhodospirillaceae bacterium]|nr:hypothetical protein [Rhodospirillaceae bacterium]
MGALVRRVRVCLPIVAAGFAVALGASTSGAGAAGAVALDLPGRLAHGEPGMVEGQATAAAAPVFGDCHDGWFWSGGPFDNDAPLGGGGASYQGCDAGDVILLLSCVPDSPDIVLEVPDAPGGYRLGDALSGLAAVDGIPHPLSGRVGELVTGEPITQFAVDRHGGLLDALAAGQRMALSAGDMELRLHLMGAADALAAMLSACPEPR